VCCLRSATIPGSPVKQVSSEIGGRAERRVSTRREPDCGRSNHAPHILVSVAVCWERRTYALITLSRARRVQSRRLYTIDTTPREGRRRVFAELSCRVDCVNSGSSWLDPPSSVGATPSSTRWDIGTASRSIRHRPKCGIYCAHNSRGLRPACTTQIVGACYPAPGSRRGSVILDVEMTLCAPQRRPRIRAVRPGSRAPDISLSASLAPWSQTALRRQTSNRQQAEQTPVPRMIR